MDTAIVYGLIGVIHFIVFILILAVVKLWLIKSISANKIMYYYIIIFLILILILGIYGILYGSGPEAEYSSEYFSEAIAATIGEMVGLGIVFLIFDSLIIWIGKKVFYRKKRGDM